MRVAIDAMGGDSGPAAVIAGVTSFLQEDRETECILFGREDAIVPALKAAGLDGHRQVIFRHTSEVVEMSEKLSSVRRKRDSAVFRAADAAAEGEADGVVLIGNTLAAVAACTMRLRLIEGVHRPGLAGPFPNAKGSSTVVMDLGANTASKAEHLVDYAVMASIYAKVLGVARPRVGLLNVGEELGKGNDMLRRVFDLLTEAPIEFIGNVEGNDIYKGTCEVIVCDGFVGNAILKASEGVAELVRGILKSELSTGVFRRLGAFLTRGAFVGLKRRTDYAEYGGAVLLGVKGHVIIGHGRSDGRAVCSAIKAARNAARAGVTGRIKSELIEIYSKLQDAEPAPPQGGEAKIAG